MTPFFLSGFSTVPDMATAMLQEINGPSGARALFLLILATILLILLLYSNAIDVEQEWSATAHATEAASGHTATFPEATDDLTRIEGVGPKISEILRAAGLSTFAALADADAETIQAVLDEAGSRYRLADPGSWPEQASLAATQDWDGLENLQGQLTGGR
jgi:predicted flap endonuclease-1-like 5' DNA nuclease